MRVWPGTGPSSWPAYFLGAADQRHPAPSAGSARGGRPGRCSQGIAERLEPEIVRVGQPPPSSACIRCHLSRVSNNSASISRGRCGWRYFCSQASTPWPGMLRKSPACARKIRPDRIHLNTIARPPAEDFATAVSRAQLEELTGLFDPPARIAAGFSGRGCKNGHCR